MILNLKPSILFKVIVINTFFCNLATVQDFEPEYAVWFK